jgi:hypothetical protein
MVLYCCPGLCGQLVTASAEKVQIRHKLYRRNGVLEDLRMNSQFVVGILQLCEVCRYIKDTNAICTKQPPDLYQESGCYSKTQAGVSIYVFAEVWVAASAICTGCVGDLH